MKDSRLLNILLYVSKAAEGYMAEKHGTEESYLVFSNWLPPPFLFFQHSWTEPPWLKYRKHELNTPLFLHGHTATNFPEAQWSLQLPVSYDKQEMKENRFFFKGTTNVKLFSSYQVLASSAKRYLKLQLHQHAQIGVGSFISTILFKQIMPCARSQPFRRTKQSCKKRPKNLMDPALHSAIHKLVHSHQHK